MRIISNFRDYYDPIQSLGQDRNLIYKREPSKIVYQRKLEDHFKDNYPFAKLDDHYSSHKTVVWKDYTVGFAGKLYPMIRLATLKKDWPRSYLTALENIEYCYSLDKVDEYIKLYVSNDDWKKFQSKRYNTTWFNCGRT